MRTLIVLRRSFLTLIEILVVIFILALGAVLTGVKIQQASKEQQFLSSVELVLNHLQLAQDLMLLMDADVYFHIVKNKEKRVEYWLEVDKPIVIFKENKENQQKIIDKDATTRWTQVLQRHTILYQVYSFAFDDASSLPLQEQNPPGMYEQSLILRFSLGKMTSGRLLLSQAEAISPNPDLKKITELTDAIYLVGYPAPIRRQVNVPTLENRINESTALYPRPELH